MRIHLLGATFVACACTFALSLSSAQAQATRPPVGGIGGAPAAAAPVAAAPVRSASAGSPVAVIDLGYIFKNHVRFKASMDDLKKDAESFEAWLRQQRETAQKMQEKLRTFNAGTPDYKKLEEDMARMQSEVQVQMQLKKKDLMEREAKTYFNIYNEVVAVVSDFADRNGISLVIRYSRDNIDKDNASSVLQGVNRPVVFQRNLDITDVVLGVINRGTPPASVPTGPGGGGTPVGRRPGDVLPPR